MLREREGGSGDGARPTNALKIEVVLLRTLRLFQPSSSTTTGLTFYYLTAYLHLTFFMIFYLNEDLLNVFVRLQIPDFQTAQEITFIYFATVFLFLHQAKSCPCICLKA